MSLAACAPQPASRIVLIVIDTLRADHLGAYGYERPTSPRLDAWAESGRLFERALATSPWTLPSMGSIYTGLLPGRHAAGAVVRKDDGRKPHFVLDPKLLYVLAEGVRTLAEILSDEGYETAALISNPFLSPRYGVDRGFDTYDYVSGNNKQSRRAGPVVDRALSWLDAHADEKSFLVVHFFDPHMNYDAPPPFRGRFTSQYPSEFSLPIERGPMLPIGMVAPQVSDADRRFIVAAYDEELRYVDEQLGRLLEGLDEREVLTNGLVLLTSDHGEELFDHGDIEHGHAMWQELLHVPLVVWGAGVEPGRDETPVSIADLMPTILDGAGSAVPDGLDGQSLWPTLRGDTRIQERTLYAEGTLRGPERMVAIRWPDKVVLQLDTGTSTAVDLEADAAETGNSGPADRERADRLLADLQAQRHRLDDPPKSRPAEKIDPETAAALRALGYIQ